MAYPYFIGLTMTMIWSGEWEFAIASAGCAILAMTVHAGKVPDCVSAGIKSTWSLRGVQRRGNPLIPGANQ
jgi:hypothetical protein